MHTGAGIGGRARRGHKYSWFFGAALSAAMILALQGSAAAGLVVIDQYLLHDHPDGNQNPPPYGLRLDGFGSWPSSASFGLPGGVYTFSADRMGSRLNMDVLRDSDTGDLQIHIYGTLYGGLKVSSDPDGWDSTLQGQAEVDFTYRMHVTEGTGTVKYEVTDDAHSIVDPLGNTGTITWTDQDGVERTLYLQDKFGPRHGFSARLGTGHRGVSGLSFWGWVNHSTVENMDAGGGTSNDPDYAHISASDWLLTAEPVPEPATLLLLGAGAAGAGLARRRRRRKRLTR